jgi:type IV pilus assembly protein PilB
MRDKPKVGEILVQAGIIDELQLTAALGEQARWGRRLGMTLIKLGMVQEGQLVRALAKQFDLPVASLAGKKIAPEVIALVPAKVACEHSVIPLFVKKEGRKGQLFLGMEEPSDLGVLDDLAFRTGMMIRPVMVGPSEIGEAIDRYYTGKAAAAAPTPTELVRSGDTLSETHLRRLREEATPTIAPLPELPLVMAVPEPDPVEEITAPALPIAPAPPVVAPAPIVPAPVAPVAPAPAPSAPAVAVLAPVAPSAPAPIAAPAENAMPDALALERARLLEETERTRLVAKALAHLLIEKGVLSLEELQARIEKMKAKGPGSVA